MKIDDIELPSELETEGLWVPSKHFRGVSYRVRRLFNPEWQRMLNKWQKEQGPLAITDPDPIEQDKITAQCLLETVLLDWDGFEDSDGSPLHYSREQARIFLFDKRYLKIRRDVVECASDIEERGRVSLEADAKN